jgi:Holliday junction resolvase RusA-like endonuclease
MIKLTIPGEPKGKGRPRVTKQGIAYTPKDTATYENWVKCCFLEARQQRISGDVPLYAGIIAYYAIPKSASNKVRAQMLDGTLRPLRKPDADNIVKIVLDSLNGLAYDDDKQVVVLNFEKRYSTDPRVEVEISAL